MAKAVVSPSGEVLRRIAPRKSGTVDVPRRYLDYIDQALQNVSRVGTMAWKLVGFPLDDVTIRAKTGSAEVYGKQSTGWVASYTEDYVVVMMISQGGTGSGSTGDGIRKIWETLYGVEGEKVRPARPPSPARSPRRRCPPSWTTARSCRRPSRAREGVVRTMTSAPPGRPASGRRPPAGRRCGHPGSTGC